MIVFDLGRKGGLPLYSKGILDRINTRETIVIQSIFRECGFLNSTTKVFKVPTYRNKVEFLFSFIPLSYLLIYILYLRLSTNNRTVYFPYGHLWAPILIIFCRILGMTVFYTVHDGVMHVGDKNIIESSIQKISIVFSNKVIVLSDFVKNQIIKHHKVSEDIIHQSSLGTLAQDSSIDYKKKKESLANSFLFFGRISEYKGVELLIDAFCTSDILSKKSLTIAGKSSYHIDYSNIKSKMDNFEVIDEFVSEYRIKQLFESHDVLVLPYIDATQSGVITHAMKSNTLIVVTDVGALSEQLGDDSAFICKPTKSSLAETLEQVISEDVLRREKFSSFVKSNKLAEEKNLKICKDLYDYLSDI
ncbi:hypothetical protein MADA3029_270059 [Vibrio nigripulchritudo MADA3029]|uniref:glycosyltransferase family 4 protein n=1 Tax=Vibrio nigripulchritudo TaxID=28173 RepID=UPI0003B1FCD0|nr:glycosyltransferase family 4 protein [Vibrio nigripulchritudo]CCN47623.1 hypothetical protein VIBNIMADA3020_420059 [Vibrio nigripulchritudo MADA3020]CCN56554.1 hypothetical protein VIBNIMADA3021_970049 [Vibrio nigripulchritudo MADA3021]CCN58822.1 hypothetical protein MADA3029_270059 [Vibrio nigripulchritudo MADA3029]